MLDDNLISKRPGYGDALRLQLKTLGMTQQELAEAAQLSRPTVSRAINRDELTEATAEALRLALASREKHGGSVRALSPRSPSVVRAPQRRRVVSTALCTADDLESWADSRSAQALLPELVRRLILADAEGVSEVSIRAGSGITLQGWDGIVRCESTHPFIPKGHSGWEMGVGGDPRSKAASDLANRTKSPGPFAPSQASFVFVTPRRWNSKEKWETEKRAETGWARIRVLDADDLEAWLAGCPSVHVWASRIIGTLPEGVIDLEGFWEGWSRATEPALSTEHLSAGRDEAIGYIQHHASEVRSAMEIVAESRDEATAMFFVALRGLAPEVRDVLLARALVVEDRRALQHLVASPSPLVLVLKGDSSLELSADAMRAGHLVVQPLAAAEASEGTGIEIPPVDRFRFQELLQNEGVEDELSGKLAGLARRSLTAYRRQQAAAGRAALPEWARPQHARSLLPALLAGSWNERFPGDKELVSSLARRAYEDLVDVLTPWSAGADPALRNRAGHWYLVSREDSWSVLAKYLREEDLDNFATVALGCLAELDSAYGLPAEKRWMSGILAERPRYSPEVRAGIAGTLALLGSRGEQGTSGRHHQAVSAYVVRELLGRANQDWQLWASLSPVLPLLAEAAPDEFLMGVESGLSGSDPVMRRMFTDGMRSGFFGPSSPHTGLLWALETLAWSPDHLARVTCVLAALDKVDPGSSLRGDGEQTGRLANRPLASLRSLFRSWMPQTSATLQRRMEALDLLRIQDPGAAWAVALSMLPEPHANATRNAVPEFREWALPFRPVTYQEMFESWRAAHDRLIDWIGSKGDWWHDLLKASCHLPRDLSDEILQVLDALDLRDIRPEDRDRIWEALRELVAQHRRFRNADWALPDEVVNRLDDFRRRFEPSDLIERHRWLFTYDPTLPDGNPWDEEEFEQRDKAVERVQVAAVHEVVGTLGLSGLLQLAERAELPDRVGYIAGKELEQDQMSDRLIAEMLTDEEGTTSRFILGFAHGRAVRGGEEWVVSTVTNQELGLSDEQRGTLLLLLSPTATTWDLLDSFGESASRAYWRRLRIYAVPSNHLDRAAHGLISAGRPYSAVELLGMHVRRDRPIDPDLILKVLSAAVETPAENESPGSSFSHSIGTLLDELVSAGADPKEIGRLEWATLPALRSFERRPKILHDFMATEPEFFVELIRLAFRSEHEEPSELTEDEKGRASMAYDLLESWRRVPGIKNLGMVDVAELRKWIEAARSRLEEEGRLRSGDRIIGQVLSHSPADPDGAWPCQAVRRIIEETASTRLEDGLYLGIVNSRGVTTRLPWDGGKLERGLVEKYDGLATAVSTSSPRTAAVLRRVARSYQHHAEREDLDADLLQDHGR